MIRIPVRVIGVVTSILRLESYHDHFINDNHICLNCATQQDFVCLHIMTDIPYNGRENEFPEPFSCEYINTPIYVQ